MYCQNCGEEVAETEQFCGTCGEPLHSDGPKGETSDEGVLSRAVETDTLLSSERLNEIVSDRCFRVGVGSGVAAYAIGYLIYYTLMDFTVTWSSIRIGKATYVAWFFYNAHGVPIDLTTSGVFNPGRIGIVPWFVLLVTGAISVQSVDSAVGFIRTLEGLIAGYLLLAVLGTLFFTSSYGSIRLFDAFLLMGIVFPVVCSGVGAGIRYLRSVSGLGSRWPLRIGLASSGLAILIPYAGPVGVICGYLIRQRQDETIGNSLMAVAVLATVSSFLWVV